MYLKNLQLVGFKSFADKTSVEFLQGVTAIVGPNGCGKSNVSDAIRWVLGEQSAKALRGGEMADVIFNGTDARKPFGMAEVSLTFSECQDVLKTGQLAGADINFDEVTITRRVFRDGNSEYLINKTLCRLKDVQTLFMDTGIGRSSYSIMEQGKIDKILSSHPEDRRAIFEEAAGVTKFKSQKKEALRKLEYTEANRIRVSDIIREVKRQIGSLQRQVGKARRYQALTAEIRRLDSQLGRHEYEAIQSAMRQLEREAAAFRTKAEDLRLEIDAGEGKMANLREQLAAAEARRQQALQRRRDIQSEIERHENRIRTHSDRMAETEAAVQTSEHQASEGRARLVEIQSTLASSRSEWGSACEKLKSQEASLQHAQEALKIAEAAERGHQQTIHAFQSKLLDLEGALANLRNQALTLEKQRQEFALRVQKISGEKVVGSEERQKLIQRQESLQTEVQSYKQTFEASRHAVAGGEDAVRESEQQCQHLAARIAEEQRLLSEKASRRDVLRQLHDSYEGYSEGAQALLRQLSESASSASPTVLGALANLIEVDPQFSAAIEAGLGQALQSIVVLEYQKAFDLAGELKHREKGRALFAIKEASAQGPSSMNFRREPLPGTLGWAVEAVRPQPVVAEFVNRLLADMALVRDLQQAMELHRQHPGLTLITIDGDVLDHHGILSAGARRASPLQLIGRRNEIAALDAEITQIEARLHELSAGKGEWEGRRALSRQSLGDRQSELRFQENDLTKKETLLGAMQNELRELETKIAAAHLELQELERRQTENESDLARVRQELAQAEADQTRAQSELGLARQKAEELTVERHSRSAAANDLRVAHATIRQQIHNLESQFQLLENQATEGRQFIAARESDARTGRQRIVQWQGESAEAAQQMQALQESSSGMAGQIAEIESEKTRVDSEIQTAVEALRESRRRIEEIQKQWTDHEVRLTEKRGDLGHLSERIQREYHIDLTAIQGLPLKNPSDLSSENPPSPSSPEIEAEMPPDEAAPKSESVEPSFLDFENWDQVALRVTELRAKIQSMGPVNVEAVQEYEELEQRFAFLTREHDDLVLSKDQLLEILQKISVTTRSMFAETFEKIRQNFQGVFTELFGGGKADLILVGENDPLECGIEIVAKPPGKQLQSIMLLSGGERTMTAVSLLFAIYMVKPSPFCVLDEMDAPLDESNINRFVKMLERFLVHSQFVIITHNKRTIAMADALYGVTMEERGVSKLISVKFHRRNENRSQADAVLFQETDEEASGPQEAASRLLIDAPSIEAADR